MSTRRLIIALLLSPLMTPLVFVVTVIFRNSLMASAAGVPFIFALYTPFAYASAFLFGLPLFFVLRYLGWSRPIAFVIGGAGIGVLVALLISHLLITWSLVSGDYGWCALAGGLSALLFWLICYGNLELSGEGVSSSGKI